MIASCGFLVQQGRSQEFGSERQSEKKEVQSEILAYQEKEGLSEEPLKVGVKKLLRAGMMPARTWGVHAVGMAPTERFKKRRQMAAAAGKKSTTSLPLFMEASGLDVEEELANQTWAEGVWIGKWHTEQREAWLNLVLEVQMWRQLRGPAGGVVRETRDLGIKWPHCHTLIFEGDRKN